MSIRRQLQRGLAVLFRRDAADQDLSDELEHYVTEAAAAYVRQGLNPAEAERRARMDAGSLASVREEVRSGGWESLIETGLTDVRYALRRLVGSPGFTFVTTLTLALGIGATTAIVSAVTPILFRPLPYPHAERLAAVVEDHKGVRGAGTFALYHAFADQTHSFDALAVTRRWQPTLTGSGRPDRLVGERVSHEYLRVLGVSPLMGRDFTETEDRLSGPRVVVVSDGLWRGRLSADPAILGKSLMLDGDPYLVIGVMPPGFEDVEDPAAELWAPLQYDMSQGTAWGHHLRTVGRLKPGLGLGAATADVAGVGRTVLTQRRPETYDPNTDFMVASLQGELTRGVRPALLTIVGAVILVLLIALVNVTNLLLARGVQRRTEFALRAALGAGRSRLVRQLLTESLVVAAVGGALGIAVAAVGVKAIVALSPAGLPRADAIAVNGTVLLVGALVTTLVGLAVGILPALHATRSDPQQDIQQGSRRTVGGHRRARGILVAAEVALALVLLVGSGLLLRSSARLFAVDVGFDQARMLTMQVQLSGHRFDDDSSIVRFYTRALDAVRAVPGVTAAGFTTQLPLSSDDDEYGAHFDAEPDRPAATYDVFRYAVTPGYLETLGVPLLSGRSLGADDRAGSPLVAVISASLARDRFGAADPLHRQLKLGPAGPYTIVGVVGDVHQASLAQSQGEAVYLPVGQWPFPDRSMSLVLRGRGALALLAPAAQSAVWSVDPDQPIVRVATMSDLVARTAGERRFALTLFELFALAALGLAAAGIYGVLSGSVNERTRELGIRSALGASRTEVVRMVVSQGARLTGVGAVLGLIAAAGLSRLIASLLFETPPVEPVTYLTVTALLFVVALVACSVPAVRASRVDPVEALRAD
ncbi:MAG TPA: ABC transporter permease [Gemmatimonadales bacterium]|nr:ABC transporter permease [Gemmatimonadales bacterium]